MNKIKIAYWVTNGLLCAMMMFSAIMYLLNQEYVAGNYAALGFPIYLMYFNAAAKVLGGVGILFVKNKAIKEWSYAGYAYILFFALLSHVMVNDGLWFGSVLGIIFFVPAYWLYKKL